MKKIAEYAKSGIAWGAVLFVAVNIIGCLLAGNGFTDYLHDDFIRYSVGTIIIAFCYIFPSILYTYNINTVLATAIHFAIGTSGFLLTALSLGFLMGRSIIWALLLSALAFFLIWILFYLDHKKKKSRR
ncbi:MAG: DUF3021 family protein [Spirochaetes bacterium]|uniref:DUF3021 family protein n=1 Tax=Candidatus Ornithospirochaeta stercoripullorum TaxID=2840899 RepID=A0A9D9H3Y8_9SPIO|nr:DUF3021 family protein [Candidatus Ornithospirochaeta stercoripullorum]